LFQFIGVIRVIHEPERCGKQQSIILVQRFEGMMGILVTLMAA
jgi:hypothetical protein